MCCSKLREKVYFCQQNLTWGGNNLIRMTRVLQSLKLYLLLCALVTLATVTLQRLFSACFLLSIFLFSTSWSVGHMAKCSWAMSCASATMVRRCLWGSTSCTGSLSFGAIALHRPYPGLMQYLMWYSVVVLSCAGYS